MYSSLQNVKYKLQCKNKVITYIRTYGWWLGKKKPTTFPLQICTILNKEHFMDPNMFSQQQLVLFPADSHWNDVVTNMFVKCLCQFTRMNYPGGNMLDHVNPSVYTLASKLLNDTYGIYHTYNIDECKEKMESLFHRFLSFGYLLNSGCAHWNSSTNELKIENHAKFSEICFVSNSVIVSFLKWYTFRIDVCISVTLFHNHFNFSCLAA